MTLLAVETSCDETSAAVIRDGRVLSNLVASQIRLHAAYGGVVPELATREHLRNWLSVTQAALEAAGVPVSQVDAVAATQGPGLPNALLIGFQAAQAVAFALQRPFLGVHHHLAHLYSPWIGGTPPAADFAAFEPNVSLVVSGGHTLLVHVPAELEHRLLGATLDDAAGECFDKTAKLLGLAYPGGPEMDRLAEHGNPDAFPFPRPLLKEPDDNFSFSGLKTAVRYFLAKHPALLDNPARRRDLCASVQQAIVDVLVAKTVRAARRLGVPCVTASGGVTCNRALRRHLALACARHHLHLRLAERGVCTDNAAMIGILAERQFLRGHPPTPLDAEIRPHWELEDTGP
ncbi:MAG: tRNA (adenosine(37)-N6)-threonylcarbamoyltransferase complex transferase subunit TsaD [Verrucomicrobia bacterium]|nr:tRNA (adenosine(37)-N6)-threonylcarbamoyltransferase complex transferase subunit TsaD [Verrucomicrobiota bacterium]